jgi:hypothetical protein
MPTDEYDEDDDRPRRPRSSRDDEDDRPARRPRDEDDYDDKPRRTGAGGKPHHGVLVLVLGILGICCGICGLVAFIIGLLDIGKMNKGQMDPSGKGMTIAGMIIGLIGFLLNCAGGIYYNMNPGAFK